MKKKNVNPKTHLVLCFFFLDKTNMSRYNTTAVCPKSCDPFYTVIYYISWVTNSWTYSTRNKFHLSRRIRGDQPGLRQEQAAIQTALPGYL